MDSVTVLARREVEGELVGSENYYVLFYETASERCLPHTHLYEHGCRSNALRIHTILSFIS